jgi:hypothetical protein
LELVQFWKATMPVQPFDPIDLVGAADPLVGTPLLAGETIRFCPLCKVGYHEDSFAYLQANNGGRCAICRQSQGLPQLLLPAGGRSRVNWMRVQEDRTVSPVAQGVTTIAATEDRSDHPILRAFVDGVLHPFGLFRLRK